MTFWAKVGWIDDPLVARYISIWDKICLNSFTLYLNTDITIYGHSRPPPSDYSYRNMRCPLFAGRQSGCTGQPAHFVSRLTLGYISILGNLGTISTYIKTRKTKISSKIAWRDAFQNSVTWRRKIWNPGATQRTRVATSRRGLASALSLATHCHARRLALRFCLCVRMLQ